ncbi:MAG: hypothetical protein VYB56_04420 [Actinomycetota bacterium]|nr:hypothetical protein [Actinomycetota bacterium]
MTPSKWRVAPLLAWTYVVWVSRSRTVLLNDQLNAVELAWRLLVAAIFLTLASVVLFHMVRGTRSWKSLQLLALWSTGFWIIRGGGILIDSQWTIGFKIVHTLLMFGTFALVAVSMSGKRR